MKVSDFVTSLTATFKGIAKIALQSRHSNITSTSRRGPLIVLANGPSLKETIAQSLPALKSHDTMSVNFMPVTPEFFDIKPKYHVLADPLFFADRKPFNVEQLYKSLSAVSWPLTLLVPVKNLRLIPDEP